MPTNDIKKIYNDALYWATSKQTKEKNYHLTRTQEAILRKLIHYSTTNPKITYSNKVISEHTFIDKEVIRKEIPKIVKKGFISSASITVTDGEEIYKRRTIYIKWDFVQTVLNDIPTQEESIPESEPPTSQLEPESFIVEEIPVDEPIKEDEPEVPFIELTQEKIDWAYELLSEHDPNYKKEDIHLLKQPQLLQLFYPHGANWNYSDDAVENIFQWRLHQTTSNKCEVYKGNTTNEKITLNIHDLEAYLESMNLTFKDFNQTIYDDIVTNGLPKREVAVHG